MLKDRLGKAISRLWNGRCDVINYVDEVNENGVTETNKIVIAENVPCRVSYTTDNAGVQTNTTDNISQQIKLFISNDIKIKPGSDIIVTQNGATKTYVSAGTPATYTAHQEVMLTDKEVFA